MRSLTSFVARLVGTERVGGRLHRTSDGILRLHDCASWTHDYTDMVHAIFPEVTIDIVSCRQSLSGFAVDFVWRGGGGGELWWHVVIGVVLASCWYALMASPWWGAYRWIHSI